VAPDPHPATAGEGSNLATGEGSRRAKTGRECKEENVVLTPREREVERIDSQLVGQGTEISVNRDARSVDDSADLAGSTEPLEVQEESVGNVDGRGAPSPSQPGSQLELRLWQKMAVDCAPRRGSAFAAQTSASREPDRRPAQGRAHCEELPPRGRQAERNPHPETISGFSSRASHPAAPRGKGGDHRQDSRDGLVGGQIASG
jgi:hypothetical protein